MQLELMSFFSAAHTRKEETCLYAQFCRQPVMLLIKSIRPLNFPKRQSGPGCN